MFCKPGNPLHEYLANQYGEDTARYIIYEKFNLDVDPNNDFKYNGLLKDIDTFVSDFNNLRQAFVDSSYFKRIKKVVGYDGYKDIKQAILNADEEDSYNMIQRVQDIFSNPIIGNNLALSDGSHVKMKRDNVIDYIINNKRDTEFISHYEMFDKYSTELIDIEEVVTSENHFNLVTYDYLFSKHPDDLLLTKFLMDLSQATGTEYVVLNDDEFYKMLLQEVGGVGATNIDEKEVQERFENINAFVRNGDVKKIYFRRSKLNKDIAIHETFHLVIDLIKAENSSLYHDIVEYIKGTYSEEYNKFTSMYEDLYKDSDNIEEEGVIYVLQNLTKTNIKSIKDDSILNKIIYYIKKVIAYLLGGYHFKMWANYFDTRLEILSDDVFLQEKLSQVNEILKEKGLNLPYNNTDKPFIKFNIQDRDAVSDELLQGLTEVMNKLGFRFGDKIDESIINNMPNDTRKKILNLITLVTQHEIDYANVYNKSYGLNYLSNIVINSNKNSNDKLIYSIKKLHRTLLSFDENDTKNNNVILMYNYLLNDVKEKIGVQDIKENIKKDVISMLLRDRENNQFFSYYSYLALSEVVNKKVENKLKIKDVDNNGQPILRDATIQEVVTRSYVNGVFSLDALLAILDDEIVKTVNDKFYESFRKVFYNADYDKLAKEARETIENIDLIEEFSNIHGLTEEDKRALLNVVSYFTSNYVEVATLDSNVFNNVMLYNILNEDKPENLYMINLFLQYELIDHVLEYVFIKNISDVYSELFDEQKFREIVKKSYNNGLENILNILDKIDVILKEKVRIGFTSSGYYSLYDSIVYKPFKNLTIQDKKNSEDIIHSINQTFGDRNLADIVGKYIKENIVPLLSNYYDVAIDNLKYNKQGYLIREIQNLSYQFKKKHIGSTDPLLELLSILTYSYASKNNNEPDDEGELLNIIKGYRNVFNLIKKKEVNEQFLLKYTPSNTSGNLTDEQLEQERNQFVLKLYKDYVENNKTYVLPFGVSLLLAADYYQFNKQFFGNNGVSTVELSLRFVNFYNVVSKIANINSEDSFIKELKKLMSGIKSDLDKTKNILITTAINYYLTSREKGVTESAKVKQVDYAYNYLLMDKFFYGAEKDLSLTDNTKDYDSAIYGIFVKTIQGIINKYRVNENFIELVENDIDKFVNLLKELPRIQGFEFTANAENIYESLRHIINKRLNVDIEAYRNLTANSTNIKYDYKDYIQTISARAYKYIDGVTFNDFVRIVRRLVGGIRSNNSNEDYYLSNNLLKACTDFNIKSNFFFSILLYEDNPINERIENENILDETSKFFNKMYIIISNLVKEGFKLVDVTEYEGLVFGLIHELVKSTVSSQSYENTKLLLEKHIGRVNFTADDLEVHDTTNLELFNENLTSGESSNEYMSVIRSEDYNKSKDIVVTRIKNIRYSVFNDDRPVITFKYIPLDNNGLSTKSISIDVNDKFEEFADFYNQIESTYQSVSITVFNKIGDVVSDMKKEETLSLLFDEDKNINQHHINKILVLLLNNNKYEDMMKNVELLFDIFLDNLINYKMFRSVIYDDNMNTSKLDVDTYKKLRDQLNRVEDLKTKRLFKFLMLINSYASRETSNTVIKNLEINLLRLQQEIPDYELEYKNFILLFNTITSYSRSKFITDEDRNIIEDENIKNAIERVRELFEGFLSDNNYVFRLNHNILSDLFNLHVKSVKGINKVKMTIDTMNDLDSTLKDGSNVYITTNSLFSLYDKFDYSDEGGSRINSLYKLESTLFNKIFTFNSEGYVIENNKKRSLKDIYDEKNSRAIEDIEEAIDEVLKDKNVLFVVSTIFEKIKSLGNNGNDLIAEEFEKIKAITDKSKFVKYMFVDNKIYYIHLMELMRTSDNVKQQKDIKKLMVLSHLLGNILYERVKDELSKNNNITNYKLFERIKKEERIYDVNFKQVDDTDNIGKNILADQLMSAYFTFPKVSKSGMLRMIRNIQSNIEQNIPIFQNDVFIEQTAGSNFEDKYFFNWSYFKDLLTTLLINRISAKNVVENDNTGKFVSYESYITGVLDGVIRSIQDMQNIEDVLVYVDSGNELFNNITSPSQYTAIFGLSSAEFNDVRSLFYYIFSTFEKAYLTNTFFDKTVRSHIDTEQTTGNGKVGRFVNPKRVVSDSIFFGDQVVLKYNSTKKLHDGLFGNDVTTVEPSEDENAGTPNLKNRIKEVTAFVNGVNITNSANVAGLQYVSLDSMKKMLKSFYYDSIQYLYSLNSTGLNEFYNNIENNADRLLNTFMYPYVGMRGNIKEDGYDREQYDLITESKRLSEHIVSIKNLGRMDLLNRDIVMKNSNLLYQALMSTLYGFDKNYSYTKNKEGISTNTYLILSLFNKDLTDDVVTAYQKLNMLRKDKRHIRKTLVDLTVMQNNVKMNKLSNLFFDIVESLFEQHLATQSLQGTKKDIVNNFITNELKFNSDNESDVENLVNIVIEKFKQIYKESFNEREYEVIKRIYLENIENNFATVTNSLVKYLIDVMKEKDVKKDVISKAERLLNSYKDTDVNFHIQGNVYDRLITTIQSLNGIEILIDGEQSKRLSVGDNNIHGIILAIHLYRDFWNRGFRSGIDKEMIDKMLSLFIDDTDVRLAINNTITNGEESDWFNAFKTEMNKIYKEVNDSFGVRHTDTDTTEYNYNLIKLDEVGNDYNNEVLQKLKALSKSLNVIVELLIFKNTQLREGNTKLDKEIDNTLYDVATLYASVFSKYKRKFSEYDKLDEDIYARFLAPTSIYLFENANNSLENNIHENNYKAILDTAFSYDKFLLNENTTKAFSDIAIRLFYDLNKDNTAAHSPNKWFRNDEVDASYWQVLNHIAEMAYNDTIVRPLEHSVASFNNTMFLYDSLKSSNKLHIGLLDYSLSNSNPASKELSLLMWAYQPMMLESNDIADKIFVHPSRWLSKTLGNVLNTITEHVKFKKTKQGFMPPLSGERKTHENRFVNKHIRMLGVSANRAVTQQLYQLAKQSTKVIPLDVFGFSLADGKKVEAGTQETQVTANPSMVKNIEETILLLQHHILLNNPFSTKWVMTFVSLVGFTATFFLMMNFFSMFSSVILVLLLATFNVITAKMFRVERFKTARENIMYKLVSIAGYLSDIFLSIVLQPIFYMLTGFLSTERLFSKKTASWFVNEVRKYKMGQALTYSEENNRRDFNNKNIFYSVASGLGNMFNVLGLRNSFDSSTQNAVAFDMFMEYDVGGYTISDIFELEPLKDKDTAAAYIFNFRVKDNIRKEGDLDTVIDKLRRKPNKTDGENKILAILEKVKEHIDSGNKSINLTWIIDKYSEIVDNKFLSHIYDRVSNTVMYQSIKSPFKSAFMLAGIQFAFVDVVVSSVKNLLRFAVDSLTRGKSLLVLLLTVLGVSLLANYFKYMMTIEPSMLTDLRNFITYDPRYELNVELYGNVVGYFKNILTFLNDLFIYNNMTLFVSYVALLYGASKALGYKLYKKYNNYFFISLLVLFMFNTFQKHRDVGDVGYSNPIESMTTAQQQKAYEELVKYHYYKNLNLGVSDSETNAKSAERLRLTFEMLRNLVDTFEQKHIDVDAFKRFFTNYNDVIDYNIVYYATLTNNMNYLNNTVPSLIRYDDETVPKYIRYAGKFVDAQQKFMVNINNRVLDMMNETMNDTIEMKKISMLENSLENIKDDDVKLKMVVDTLNKEIEDIDDIVYDEFVKSGLSDYCGAMSYTFYEKYISVGRHIGYRAMYSALVKTKGQSFSNRVKQIEALKSEFESKVRYNFAAAYVKNVPDPREVVKEISSYKPFEIEGYINGSISDLRTLLNESDKITEDNWGEYFDKLMSLSKGKFISSLLGIPDFKSLLSDLSIVTSDNLSGVSGFEVTKYMAKSYKERGFENIYLVNFVNEPYLKTISYPSESTYKNIHSVIIFMPYEFKPTYYLSNVRLSPSAVMFFKMFSGKGSLTVEGKLPSYFRLLADEILGINDVKPNKGKMLKDKPSQQELVE